MTERELHEPVALCRSDGQLDRDAVGWSRHPVHDCALPGSWGRRKRWDYWCVTGPRRVLSITYANVDYLGLADAWFLDLPTGRTATCSVLAPGGRSFSLPDHVAGGDMEVAQGGTRIAIREEAEGTRLVASSKNLECDVLVGRPPGHETLSVVIPWSERRFQCTTKENTRPAEGHVNEYAFDAGESWGCLDFGRGKWHYRTVWNWGSASGRAGDHVVGLQFGGKWTAGTGMTENALCVDGRLSKISEELDWEYDPADWLRPWRIRTPQSDRVELTFKPEHDKVTRMQLGVASSAVHQCFGTYEGTIVPDGMARLDVSGLFGWAEEARWRW